MQRQTTFTVNQSLAIKKMQHFRESIRFAAQTKKQLDKLQIAQVSKEIAKQNNEFFEFVKKAFDHPRNVLLISRDEEKIKKLVQVLNQEQANLWEDEIFNDQLLPFIALGALYQGKITIYQCDAIVARYTAIKDYGKENVKTLYMLTENGDDFSQQAKFFIEAHLPVLKSNNNDCKAQYIQSLLKVTYSDRFVTVIKNKDFGRLADAIHHIISFPSINDGNETYRACILFHTHAWELLNKSYFGQNYIANDAKLGVFDLDELEQYQVLKVRLSDCFFPGVKALHDPDGFKNQKSTIVRMHDRYHCRSTCYIPNNLKAVFDYKILSILQALPKNICDVSKVTSDVIDRDYYGVFVRGNSSFESVLIWQGFMNYIDYALMSEKDCVSKNEPTAAFTLLLLYDLALNPDDWLKEPFAIDINKLDFKNHNGTDIPICEIPLEKLFFAIREQDKNFKNDVKERSANHYERVFTVLYNSMQTLISNENMAENTKDLFNKYCNVINLFLSRISNTHNNVSFFSNQNSDEKDSAKVNNVNSILNPQF